MNEDVENKADKKAEPKISAINFVGLGFADKKEGRGLPAGLIPISDPFPTGNLPDVEIIVGDTSRFGNEKASESNTTTEDDSELYKPKVSTWGVFPRPNNISKTYGGGKTIRPGDVLETAESKAAKDARTKQMIAAYKTRMGLNIDPKLKSECEKDLKDGDSLMEIGKLRDAIPFYERVMDKLVYQSELHGLAALQWSICLDSLNRSSEARVMYERLQSHPNVGVSKKARQFVFSFQAMEMMKVTSSSVYKRKTGYQNFFDAFVESKNNLSSVEAEVEEDAAVQALPYYGGGKTIRPGDVLETAESKAEKDARTKQMIAAYKTRMGLNIDPKLKSECEKDLKDGDSLMEIGKLRDAIPFYERVMDKLVYQSELHGLAALQWSICLDSLNRSNEARVMYERLQSHPNVGVSKKARQFVFSFQAMEMMKVTSSSVYKRKTGYQNFFDAFVENKNNLSSVEAEVEEDAAVQALPYVIFLVSPILMILVIAVQKRLV